MTRSLTPTRMLAGALLAVSLLGGAACSSGGSDGGDAARATTTTAAEVPTGKQDYIDGFIIGISSGGLASPDQGQCIATAWVDLIGVDALIDNEITAGQFGDIDPESYRKLELSTPETDALFDLLKPCGLDLVGLLRSPASPNVTEPEQACVDEVVTTDTVRAAFAAGITEVGGDAKMDALGADVQACFEG